MKHAHNKNTTRALWFASAIAWTVMSGGAALADDTEVYVGDLGANSPQANILFVIDTSGSMRTAVNNDPQSRDRLKVVQDVATQLINDVSGVNIGIMKYSDNDSDRNETSAEGGMIVHDIEDVDDARGSLINEINIMHHDGYTPLSEAYYEAALFFMGRSVDYGLNSREGYRVWSGDRWRNRIRDRRSVSAARNGSVYDSPIEDQCQKNYIVYLSDGEPTQDTTANSKITALLNESGFTQHSPRSCSDDHPNPSYPGSGICLDELSEFLYENDIMPSLPGKQNVVTYTIGFASDLPILEDTATVGGGEYKQANNAAELTDTLTRFFAEIVDLDSSFTAPAVSVNAFDRTTHLNQVFFTVFKPSASAHWDGNLKKYNFSLNSNDDGLVITGQDGGVAVNPNSGFFYDGRDDNGNIDPTSAKAWSYWSASADGATVAAGGAANELTLGRNIYTFPGSGSGALTGHPVGASNTDMRSLLDGIVVPPAGLSQNDHLDNLLEWAGGVDVTDVDEDGNRADARQVMGDPLHSKPAVIQYGGSAADPQLYVFVGTNDGYLHAIDSRTGAEKFAFMPRDLWANIPQLYANNEGPDEKVYGVDGHITAWVKDGGDGQINPGSGDFVRLYFGLRRGGSAYYALDVTNINNPQMMWSVNKTSLPLLGQSWSKPVVTRVNLGTAASPVPKDVIVIGGGYDPDQDDAGNYQNDNDGNAIYMLDAQDGSVIWSGGQSGAVENFPAMASSIPASVRVLDLNLDGFADRMYTVDIGGRVWRFDIHDASGPGSFRVSGGAIASLGGAYDPGKNRRFYYAPDVAIGNSHGQGFLNITVSSGFRAHPLDKDETDYLYAVRDYQPFTRLGQDPADYADDYDYGVTHDNLYQINGSSSGLPQTIAGLRYRLSGDGEKSLAPSRIFQNLAYFTTYTPDGSSGGNTCGPAIGSGRLYTIDLGSGLVRDVILKKPGIPPEPTFIFGPDPNGDPETGTCFGEHCDDPDDPDPDDDEEDGGRVIECLAGPESCDAGITEVPRRTYWRQVTDQ